MGLCFDGQFNPAGVGYLNGYLTYRGVSRGRKDEGSTGFTAHTDIAAAMIAAVFQFPDTLDYQSYNLPVSLSLTVTS